MATREDRTRIDITGSKRANERIIVVLTTKVMHQEVAVVFHIGMMPIKIIAVEKEKLGY